jgi:hypothetical protein
MTNAVTTPGSSHRPPTRTDRVRDILALVIVVGFVAITAVLAVVFPAAGLAPADQVISYLKDIASIYTGIVGLIIGYYFGRQE